MENSERAKQESPSNFKHLAIHVLVELGFLVFSNIAAKETIDVVIGMPTEEGGLRTAGVRIKTSSYKVKTGGWDFSQELRSS